MTIDVGPGCGNRGFTWPANYSLIVKDNPANAAGTIDYVCVYADSDMSGIEFASFADEGSEVLSTNGNTSGSNLGAIGDQQNEYNAPGDFTAFNINVGEYIGIYWSGGNIDRDSSGFAGMWWVANDQIPCSSVTFNLEVDDTISLYAIGTEAGGETYELSALISGASATGSPGMNVLRELSASIGA